MPYFDKSNHHNDNIDLPGYQPVSVIVNTTKDGRFRPEYICIQEPDESLLKIKIDGIKYVREYPHYHLFCCYIILYGSRKEIFLLYRPEKFTCCWFIKYS